MNVRVTVPVPPANLSPEKLKELQRELIKELTTQLGEAEKSGVSPDDILGQWDDLAVHANLSTEMRNTVLKQAAVQRGRR